ncbi:hypothetical protein V8B97DRAFT_1876194 [Scleroderma yunnanense]
MVSVKGDVTTVATVYGSILLGTCFASGLTGIVFVQSMLYYKLYPGDYAWTKFLVFVVWALDLMHTILIISTVWHSVITNYNKPENMDIIPAALGLSVAVTAAITFLVHCFFANRIRKLMKNWYIAAPVVRLAPHLVHTFVDLIPSIRLKRYSLFIRPYPAWIFTSGVTLSASVEIIITTTMIIFLRTRKTGFANMNHIINSLILYTLETGGSSALVTVTSLICWLIMRHNLIFLGMHFAIAKLYANSLLATLNTRKRLRIDRMYSSERDQNGLAAGGLPYSNPNRSHISQRILGTTATQKSLNVNVETTVVSKIDERFDDFDEQRDSCVTDFEKDVEQGGIRDSAEKTHSADFP